MSSLYFSFMRLPLWVKIWVFFWLAPMNMGGLLFLDHPVGVWCASLGLVGMLPNLVIMSAQCGFSNAMAFPHLIPWTVLVVWLPTQLIGPNAPDGMLLLFAWALVATNFISLLFDYTDAYKWWRGDREIA